MKSVRNRIANEIKNHELLQNANTTIDRVPLSAMTNQLNKSAPAAITLNSGAILHTEKVSEIWYQSTDSTITEVEIECESADSPTSEIDDDKSTSMVSEMTSENISQLKTDQSLETILPWDELIPALQDVLPNQRNVMYIVTNYAKIASCSFSGAPRHAFEATVRMNISSKKEAQSWLQEMMCHSKCTYCHTKGRTPGQKRVFFKVEMHCQHYKNSSHLNNRSKVHWQDAKMPERL